MSDMSDDINNQILNELENMTYEEIIAIHLTGRFTGLFKEFSQMSKSLEDKNGKIYYNS